MRQLTVKEVDLVSGGSREAALVVGGLAVVSVMALTVMVLSSSSSYPSNIAYMSPYQAYDQGYSNGYYASYGLNVLVPNLLDLAVVIASSDYSDDDSW